MNKEFISLFKKYMLIKNLKWIKSLRKGYGGIGYTFETLLGKNEESFPIPDYNGIEIKTMRIYSKNVIHLFSIVPDGDFLYPMKRVLDILGYPDKQFKEYKILNKDFNCVEYSQIGYYRMAKLEIDRKSEKLLLIARDYLGNDLNVNISWSFKLLKERLYLKLKRLAIIEALTKKEKNEDYYYYKRINYYVLKDFNTFLDLIEDGTIYIGFKIGLKKDKENFGKMKSRGTIFTIKKENIEKLYKKISLEYFEYQLL